MIEVDQREEKMRFSGNGLFETGIRLIVGEKTGARINERGEVRWVSDGEG